MPSNYVINVISNAEKEAYIRVAQSAIVSLKKKITELQQMVADNVAMPTMNQPHQVAFYIKDAIGIANRPSQSGLTSGATNESYYIRFIPINKQDIVIDLRTTDHLRGEKWSDRKDNGEHPNLRASAIVQDTSDTAPTVVPKKPHIANGITIKRVVQNIPTMLYGTPEQIIKHLNTLICLFQNGYFGKYKEKKPKPPTVDSNNKTLENEQYMNRKPLIRLTESDLHRIIKESVNRILRESLEEKKDSVLKESYDVEYVRFEDIRKGILGCQGLRPSEKHALLKFWKKHEGLLWNFESFETFNMFVVAVDNECDYDACAWSETLEPPEGWTLKDVYYTTKHIINDIGYDNIDYNDYEEQLY